MMNKEQNRDKKLNICRAMIAAGQSGSGKTLITCGLLSVLKDRGINIRSFKCGPDYIDPMFHKKVLGLNSENLDSYFSEPDDIRRIIAKKGEGYALIEGVMGIYDGMSVDSIKASAYDIASISDTPIILIIDASHIGRTVISQIKGILHDDKLRLIKAIILNRISTGYYKKLKPYLETSLAEEGYEDVICVGGIPKVDNVNIDSRHLGLKLPDEIDDIKNQIDIVAKVINENCDIDKIIQIMESAKAIICDTENNKEQRSFQISEEEPILAVAHDEAFCFYYKEYLELLEREGLRIKFFSPIYDEKLPDKAAGLLLGGGYPELYLEKLSKNASMLESIKTAIENGMPSIAECGGFMYLHNSIRDKSGAEFRMVGAIEGECFYTGHLVRFGYMNIKSCKTKVFGCDLSGMKGHEFHYYESSCNGSSCIAQKPTSKIEWNCIIGEDNKFWGFPHFYCTKYDKIIEGFVKAVGDYSREEFQ